MVQKINGYLSCNYFIFNYLYCLNYHPFGMVMPGRTFNSTNYRYGMMGYEKDDEICGNGNAYDFDGYGYDPRLNRRKSLDPMSVKFADESPYSFAGNSPISLRDEDGKEKTYYMTRIAKDGTTTHLKVVEKYTVVQLTSNTRESIGLMGVTFYTSPVISNTKTFDVAQNITLDEKTGKVTVGKEYITTERSNITFVRGIEDNAGELGNYLDEATNGSGGIVFTSEIGQGQESRKGYNADAQSENIDLLNSVLNAASAAATSKQAVGFLESFKQGVDAIGILKDVKDNTLEGSSEQGEAPADKDSCTFCGQTGIGLKTRDQGGTHVGEIVPAKSEKKKN
jgi:hypothetical protein